MDIPWIRVIAGVFIYCLVLAISMVEILFYKLVNLPSAALYVCGAEVEPDCFLYVADKLAKNGQWHAIELLIYLLVSFVLWPMFKAAKGSVLINLGAVSLLVSGLFLVTIEQNGPELVASFLGPFIVATLILYRRKRRIIFNKEQLSSN